MLRNIRPLFIGPEDSLSNTQKAKKGPQISPNDRNRNRNLRRNRFVTPTLYVAITTLLGLYGANHRAL